MIIKARLKNDLCDKNVRDYEIDRYFSFKYSYEENVDKKYYMYKTIDDGYIYTSITNKLFYINKDIYEKELESIRKNNSFVIVDDDIIVENQNEEIILI